MKKKSMAKNKNLKNKYNEEFSSDISSGLTSNSSSSLNSKLNSLSKKNQEDKFDSLGRS